MFCDLELCLKKNGKFSLPWLASTRGVNFLSRKVILEANVDLLCKEIMQFLMNCSQTPRQRLSLSLSVRLIDGTTQIYHRQCQFLLEDIEKFLMSTYKSYPIDRPLAEPKTPTKRKKSGSKPASALSIAELLEEPQPKSPRHIQEETIQMLSSITPAPGITLSEDNIQEVAAEPEIEPASCLVEEVLLDVSVQDIMQMTEEQQENLLLGSSLIPMREFIQRRSMTSTTSQQQPQQITTVAEVHKDDSGQNGREPRSRRSSRSEQQAAEAPPVVADVQPIEEPQRRVPMRRRPVDKSSLREPKKFERIKRTQDELHQLLFEKDYVPRKESVNYLNEEIFAEYARESISIFFNPSEDEEILELVDVARLSDQRSGSMSPSLKEIRTSHQKSDHKKSSASSLPIIREEPLIEEQAIELEMVPEEQLPIVSFPTDKDGSAMQESFLPAAESTRVEKTVEGTLQPEKYVAAQELDVIQEIEENGSFVASTFKSKEFANVILDKLKKWDFEANPHVKIEEICPEPINRSNIAKTFVNLLHFDKAGYVLMCPISEINLELSHIEKGTRL